MLYNISFYDALVEMDKKVLIGGILLVSTVLLMYPMITNYLDLEQAYSRYHIPREVQKMIDNLRLQIIGSSLLFATLFLMIYYMKLENGVSYSSTAEQTSLPTTPSPSKPLSKNATNTVFILSAVTFFIAYVWQMIGVIMSETMTPTPLNFMGFLTPVLYSLIASAIVGIIACFIAKHYSSTPYRWEHGTLTQSDVVRKQVVKKPENEDWYQQALKQHQIHVTEDTSKQIEDLENLEPENS